MKLIKNAVLVIIAIFLVLSMTACDQEDSKGHIIILKISETQSQEVVDIIESFPDYQREGYYLEGWYLTSDFSGPQVKFPFEVEKDTTLYARWFSAEEGSPYLVYELNPNNQYTIKGYNGKSNIAVIPQEYNEKLVTAIADGAFNVCDTVKKIVLPDSINSIGRAFCRASNLEEIEVCPQSDFFTSEDGILYNKQKTVLISYPPAKLGDYFDIPKSVTSLANSAFRFCRYLKNISVPESLEDMGEIYFDNCFSLENILVSDQNSAFSSLDGVLFNKDKTILYRYPQNYSQRDYQIPVGVVEVAPYAFDQSAVRSIAIPKSLESFTAIEDCLQLEAFDVASDSNIFSSNDGVLFDKSRQTLLQYPQGRKGEAYYYEGDETEYYAYRLPNGVKTINRAAFNSCVYLNKVIIPPSLEYISEVAFFNLHGGFNLKEVVFDNNSQIKEIGSFAFMECSTLEIFWVTAIEPPILGESVFGAKRENFTVFVPNNTFELYLQSNWAHVTDNLKRGENTDFYTVNFNTCGGEQIESLETAYIKDEVIPQKQDFVFGGWYLSSSYSGERVKFPLAIMSETNLYAKWYPNYEGTEGLSFVLDNQTNTYLVVGYTGDYAEVTVPPTHNGKLVTVIGEKAFEEKSQVKKIVLPETITTIEKEAFQWANGLEEISFQGERLTTIGEYAFSNCVQLAEINLPLSVKTIGTRAFNNCSSLTTLKIPKATDSIGIYAFSDCNNLESIEVSSENLNYLSQDGVLYNKDQTALIFYPPAKQETVFQMPDSIVRIKSRAFYQAENLNEIIFSKNLRDIETDAFYQTNLSRITLPSGLENIGDRAFKNCQNLTAVYLDSEDSYPKLGYTSFWVVENLTVYVFESIYDELIKDDMWKDLNIVKRAID